MPSPYESTPPSGYAASEYSDVRRKQMRSQRVVVFDRCWDLLTSCGFLANFNMFLTVVFLLHVNCVLIRQQVFSTRLK